MKQRKEHVNENFMEFLRSAEVHQRPDVSSRFYNAYGSNPRENDQLELPFNLEDRPEISDSSDTFHETLEKMQALVDAALTKYPAVDKKSISPYIKRQFEKSFKYFKEGYLRLMDL